MTTTSEDRSLFTRVGGDAGVAAVVDELYVRVLADAHLGPYFRGVDLERLKAHQREFVAAALGGPDTYRGRAMDAAHRSLDITDDAFDRVVAHLAGALGSLGVDDGVVAEIAGALAPLRAQIVA